MRKQDLHYGGLWVFLTILLCSIVVLCAGQTCMAQGAIFNNGTDEPIRVTIDDGTGPRTVTLQPGQTAPWPGGGPVNIWAEGLRTNRRWNVLRDTPLNVNEPMEILFVCSHPGAPRPGFVDCSTTNLPLCLDIPTDCGNVQVHGNQDFDNLLCPELRDDARLAEIIQDGVNDACATIGGRTGLPITFLTRDEATQRGYPQNWLGAHTGNTELMVVVEQGDCVERIQDVAAHEYTHELFFNRVGEGRPLDTIGVAVNEGLAWYTGTTSVGETDQQILDNLRPEHVNSTFQGTGADYLQGTGQNRLKAMGLFLTRKARENGRDIDDFIGELERRRAGGITQQEFDQALQQGLGIQNVQELDRQWQDFVRQATQ